MNVWLTYSLFDIDFHNALQHLLHNIPTACNLYKGRGEEKCLLLVVTNVVLVWMTLPRSKQALFASCFALLSSLLALVIV